MPYPIVGLALTIALGLAAPVLAQSIGGHTSDAAGILDALPPDLHKKMEQLSQIIDQNVKAGKLTDAQIQQELMSGQLEHTIRSLGPEASHLMDDINSDIKNRNGPGEEALMPLIGGLNGK